MSYLFYVILALLCATIIFRRIAKQCKVDAFEIETLNNLDKIAAKLFLAGHCPWEEKQALYNDCKAIAERYKKFGGNNPETLFIISKIEYTIMGLIADEHEMALA